MNVLSGASEFFGLDIGSTGVRAVQLRTVNGVKTLSKYAYTPLDPKVSGSDSDSDQQKLGQVIADMLGQAKFTTNNVAVGLSSQRVFTTVVDIDRLSTDELAKAIRYQADSLIPTPLAESKIDWQLIGNSPIDNTKVEILLSSAPNKFIERRLETLESIGLNVIAFEPDAITLSRSLLKVGNIVPTMIVDIAAKSTDIIVVIDSIPRLTRSISTGTEAIIKAAEQTLNIDPNQAQQFVFKFGMSKDKLEGQIRQAIGGTVDILTTEIEKSIKFFQSRYTGTKLDHIIVTGGASVIPELPLHIANTFNANVEIGNAWANVAFPRDRQNELLALSNQFGVAVGLAERNE